MRLPYAYSIEYKDKINRKRRSIGLILTLIGFIAVGVFNDFPGQGNMGIAFPFGLLALLVMMFGLYLLILGLQNEKPYSLFREWPGLRTPVKSLKREIREIWEFLITTPE